jgi:hypothetical protein
MTTEDSSKDKHGEQTTENIRQQLDAFLQNRVELVLLMQEYANELDEVHKNVKITKVVTGSTGIVGTILCVTGLVLAIPTAGVSMLLTVGGGALAAASGTAHLGSDITERLITKSRLDKLNELCQADEANILTLDGFLKRESEQLKNAIGESTVRETTSSVLGEISSFSNLTCSIVRISQATTLTVNTIKFIGIASVVLSKD